MSRSRLSLLMWNKSSAHLYRHTPTGCAYKMIAIVDDELGATARAVRIITVSALLVAALAGCTTSQDAPPATSLSVPGAARVELPEALGVPVLIVSPELPAEAVAEGQRYTAVIDFSVSLKGEVVASRMASSSDPRWDELLLEQHRKWLYATATRDNMCALSRFRGLQRIEVIRTNGKLHAAAQPAEVVERFERAQVQTLDGQGKVRVPNYKEVLVRIPYPRRALLSGVEARLAVVVEFDASGAVTDAYPVNAAYDEWGFARAAVESAKRMRGESDTGRPFQACVPVEFRLR